LRRVNVEWEPVGRAAVGRREGREREEYVMRREGVKIERCKSACGEEGRLNGTEKEESRGWKDACSRSSEWWKMEGIHRGTPTARRQTPFAVTTSRPGQDIA
jgi:hypothetical protein